MLPEISPGKLTPRQDLVALNLHRTPQGRPPLISKPAANCGRKLVAGAVATGEAAGSGAAFERGLELRSYPENYGQRQAARRRGGQAGLFRNLDDAV
jgi:hypothetical protein